MPPCNDLTQTEANVAYCVWKGMSNPQIATIVGSTEQSVKNHLRKVFDKLGVWTRLELAIYIANHGGADWYLKHPAFAQSA